jgi:hypothetical protein
LTFFLRVSFSTISETSQVKPSLIDVLDVEVLQEEFVEATTIGSKKDLLIKSHVEPLSHVTIASFLVSSTLTCSRREE